MCKTQEQSQNLDPVKLGEAAVESPSREGKEDLDEEINQDP